MTWWTWTTLAFFLSNLSVFVSNYNWYLIEEINEVLVVIRSSCPKFLWNFRYNYLPTLHQSSTMYSCTSFFATFIFQNSSWSQFYIQLVNKVHFGSPRVSMATQIVKIICNLDLVTLLTSTKTVTKSYNVTKLNAFL